MASYHIEPPEQFVFSQQDVWPRWIQRFERFRITCTSGLKTKSDKAQVNRMIYSMGSDADDILSSFRLTVEDKKVYDTVVQSFEQYFIKKRNVIYERAKFNRREQHEGEQVDTVITALNTLSEHCVYGDLCNEMIRDKIVVG